MISTRSSLAHDSGSIANPNLWCTQPANERRPQSGSRNSRAGFRSSFSIEALAFSCRNSSRSSRPNSNSSPSWRANFLRSFSLRLSSKRLLAHVASATQVHSEGSESEGRFSSIASRIVSWSCRSALDSDNLGGVLEAGTFQIARGDLDTQPL